MPQRRIQRVTTHLPGSIERALRDPEREERRTRKETRRLTVNHVNAGANTQDYELCVYIGVDTWQCKCLENSVRPPQKSPVSCNSSFDEEKYVDLWRAGRTMIHVAVHVELIRFQNPVFNCSRLSNLILTTLSKIL